MKKLIITVLAAMIAVSMLAAIPAFAADADFTVAVENAEVGAGSTAASFDVYFRDVTPKGLCAVKFFVTVAGGSFTEAVVGPDMPGSFMRGETGSETISFLWVDISKGVYEDTLAATFTVNLPEGTKQGDEIPVKITFDEDPDNYLAMEEDASGENANLIPAAKDGKITVVAAGQAETKKAAEPAKDVDSDVSADSAAAQTDGTDTAQSTEATSEETEALSGRIDLGSGIGIVKATGTAEDKEDDEKDGSSLPLGAKIGIAAGAVAAVAAAVVAIIVSKKKKSAGAKKTEAKPKVEKPEAAAPSKADEKPESEVKPDADEKSDTDEK